MHASGLSLRDRDRRQGCGGGEPRARPVGRLAQIGGDRLGQRILDFGHARAVVHTQLLVLGDQPLAERLARAGGDHVVGHEGAQRVHRRQAVAAVAELVAQLIAQRRGVGEHDLLLGGEVRKQRTLGDLRRLCDLGHSRLLVAVLREQVERHRHDSLARAQLLALP